MVSRSAASGSPQTQRQRAVARIDQNAPINFTFDGRSYRGFAGDTLASALLANNVHLVGRSFKYHRPRGIMAAGSEEPNALIRLGKGAYAEPNLRATQIEIFEGLYAESQNSTGFSQQVFITRPSCGQHQCGCATNMSFGTPPVLARLLMITMILTAMKKPMRIAIFLLLVAAQPA
jgi:hypothetical protein